MSLGMPEMIFIFLLALILFGPRKLPEIGREIGKFIAEFKRASNDFKYQLQSEIDKLDSEDTKAKSSYPATDPYSKPEPPVPAETPAVTADSEHERLMSTARLAFEAQSFTLRPPESPTVAHSSEAAAPTEAEPKQAEAPAQPSTETQQVYKAEQSPAPAPTESSSQNA